ncbi:MAG: hypothetical protein JWN11_752 [Hyphomicrobiales bacterium]|nr:hypothetical protein [Hyphomicrobiales bacterium]
MIISCPYCQTRYEVAYETIGSAGRKVQCANCQKAWKAQPSKPPVDDEDRLFDAIDEQALDDALRDEEKNAAESATPIDFSRARRKDASPQSSAGHASIVATPEEPKPAAEPEVPMDPALLRKVQRAFSRRERSMVSKLPLARLRRSARRVAVIGLVLLLVAGFGFRTQIVLQFPGLAGLYDAVGLGVNVIGLEFHDIRTVQALRNGAEAIEVTGTIRSVSDNTVDVPAVIVTLLSASGAPIYQWSVTPKAADLKPGEVIALDTEVSAPPAGAARVRLTFATGRAQTDNSVALPLAAAEETH